MVSKEEKGMCSKIFERFKLNKYSVYFEDGRRETRIITRENAGAF